MKSPPIPPNVPFGFPRAGFPRAGVDPIIDETSAFGVIATQIHRPMRHETVCMCLDHAYRGLAFLIVTGTIDPDDVAEIVTHLANRPATQPANCSADRSGNRTAARLGGLAIATVRPGADRLDPVDDQRWVEIDQIAAERSIELLDWWIVGALVMQPRRWLGEPSRWPADH